jgi:hypothetical protein
MPHVFVSAFLHATQAAWPFKSKHCGRILGSLLILASVFVPICRASVPAADTTLFPVVTDNLPIISSLTAYVYPNDSDAVSNVVNGTTVYYDAPLYYPFDTDTSAWWDNLVAEELQARLPVIMFASRGTLTTNAAEVSGNMNPRQLTQMVGAMTRANVTNQFKLACFIDSPSLQYIYTSYHGIAGTNLVDMSLTNDWTQVFWLRAVKPWFDTVPSQYWFKVNGRPVIQWWSISSGFSNQRTNAAKMLQAVADSFQVSYGMRPGFIIDGVWASSADPTSLNEPDVIGVNNWFGPPSTSYTTNRFNGFTCSTTVPGFINPNYFDPSNSNYQNPSQVVPHNNINGTGTNGDTLISGLEADYAAKSQLTVLEGWNDVREWAGYYRCATSPRYDYASQYINIVRRYTDYRTETLRLEAEGADAYFDTTAGNAGGAFRRAGDLDIRTLSTNGWSVTATAAGEWIEFKDIQFSAGNYKFPVRYSATASHTLRLYIDGVALPDVVPPSTGGTNLFDTAYLGTNGITHGTHTLRLFFVDGGVDVDWIFVKKFDPAVTFQSALNGFYLAAQFGGNDSLVCNWTSPDNWERFSVDDLAGNGTLFSSNTVNLQSYNGLYLTATNGGGSTLAARQRIPSGLENFSIVKLGGSGVLTNGSQVTIQTSGGKYVTVKSDGSVDASGTSVGTAQTFMIQITSGAVQVPPVTSAPTGLIGVVTNGSQIILSWAATPGARSYNVKRSTVFGGPYTNIAANVLNSTNYLDVRLPGSTTFYYVVSAVNAGGESVNSAVASVTIPAPPTLLSQNQPVTASSFQTGNDPYKGNDGDSGTRWSANGPIYPSWWRVDLGTNCNLSSVTIDWYGIPGRSYQYTIDVSTNDVNYLTVVNQTGNTLKANTTDYFTATGRYVRITVTGTTQVNGNPSFYECLVYGSVVPAVSLAPTSIAMVASGSTISLSWPADHLGWHLQVQTNTLGTGLGTNWVTVPGSDSIKRPSSRAISGGRTRPDLSR